MMESAKTVASERPAAVFVASVVKQCAHDKGLAARLRRADNPATEYQSWEFLAGQGVDLENGPRRLAYVTTVASLARTDANGRLSLGRAIADCYAGERDASPAQARLRRLLACNEVGELCLVLRPLLSLIASRSSHGVDHVRLLEQLLWFPHDPVQVKTQWAKAFYAQTRAAAKDEDA